MGLIHVMGNLSDPSKLGEGIAVAFVATVYGVGAANLLLLTAASKIRERVKRRMEMTELILEGVAGIVEGMNPKMIRRKLEILAGDPQAKPAPVENTVSVAARVGV